MIWEILTMWKLFLTVFAWWSIKVYLIESRSIKERVQCPLVFWLHKQATLFDRLGYDFVIYKQTNERGSKLYVSTAGKGPQWVACVPATTPYQRPAWCAHVVLVCLKRALSATTVPLWQLSWPRLSAAKTHWTYWNNIHTQTHSSHHAPLGRAERWCWCDSADGHIYILSQDPFTSGAAALTRARLEFHFIWLVRM